MRGNSPLIKEIDYFDHFDHYFLVARTISATQAKVKFGELLADVSVGRKHIAIEKQGKKVAVLVPKDDYDALIRLSEFDERLSRREAFQRLIDWRDSLPPPGPDAPSAVEILRELRDRDRFS